MDKKRDNLVEDIEHLIGGVLPDEIESLSDEQFHLLHQIVHQVLDKERAGFDKFFESVSQTLKYIPNFIILSITNKYIEPPIAARITAKLPLKNAVAIAKGLSVNYICETAVFLEDEYAAELLARLPKKLSLEIIDLLYASYPFRALDILCYANSDLKCLVEPPKELFERVEGSSLSQHRESMLKELELIFDV